MRGVHRLIAARAFAVARWRQKRLNSRSAIERYHAQKLKRLVADVTTTLPFYRPYAGRVFDALPTIDKALMLEHFAIMNRPGMSADAARGALANGVDRVGDYFVGQSTGTSGSRGYFVISQAERYVWLGTLLAKTLPDALWRRHRVALAMPGVSPLYKSASDGSRIALAFFDLARGVESFAGDLVSFAPDTIVAPPKVLRWLAEAGKLRVARAFSGAETLDPLDREAIEASGADLREIYMATEGLFGVGCPHGRLHLAEDVVHFEWAPIEGGALAAPIVTDFVRRAQAMIRYRMNDLLELDERPCPCGSAYRAVRRIHGRQDDVFRLAASDGARRMVTPDVLRNAIVDSHPAILDFRVVQATPDEVLVTLAGDAPPEADTRVLAALAARFAVLGVSPRVEVRRGIVTPYDRKLRRVQRLCD